jgi:hypothetical protein
LVKLIHIFIEAEHVFMAGIVVPQLVKILNIGGRDHAGLIGYRDGVSRGDSR